MNKTQAISFIKQTAKKYKVKVTFVEFYDCGGSWKPNHVTLNKESNPNFLITAFFHELGHQHCYENNIYKAFHNIDTPNSNKELLAVISTSLKAEKFVDDWASKEVLKYFPFFKYKKTYHTDYGKLFLYVYNKRLYNYYFKAL